MNGYAISTRNLVKRYGHRHALDAITLEVLQGSITGLVGANGAGKTTWMMTVAGFIMPDSGEIDILGQGPFNAALHGGKLGILPQDSDLPSEATPYSILYRFARIQGLSPAAAKQNAVRLLEAVNMGDRAQSPIRSLSHGMRKRVMVAQCFIGSPAVVLLDEPLNGLDPVEAARLKAFILSRKGLQTIVISSHNLNDIETLCTHVAFMEKGRTVKTESIGKLTQGKGRVNYTLSAQPADLTTLQGILPGAEFSWQAKEMTLVCSFDEGMYTVESVNRVLLPELLKTADISKVTPGVSLEKVFLSERS